MEFLEKNLEDIICETSDNDLFERGLQIYGKRFRQLRIGGYGIADLVTARMQPTPYGKYIDLTIFELKKDFIDIGTFLQSIRYAKGIIRYIEKRSKLPVHISIKLVGRNIDLKSSFVYLTDLICDDDPNWILSGLKNVDFYTYNYKFDGIYFEHEHGYFDPQEGF